jgi:hypothetical protein
LKAARQTESLGPAAFGQSSTINVVMFAQALFAVQLWEVLLIGLDGSEPWQSSHIELRREESLILSALPATGFGSFLGRFLAAFAGCSFLRARAALLA